MPTVTGRATDFITFSRPGATGGGATVTDSDGKIKWAGHNLLTNSESFDASAWSKTTAASTVTANAIVAPDGTTTADLITASGAVGGVYQSNSRTSEVVRYTLGAFFKAGTVSNARLTISTTVLNNGVVCDFTLTGSGTAGSPAAFGSGWTAGTATITPLSNSWYYCTVTGTAPATGTIEVLIGHTAAAVSGNTLYAWGAHLYRSDLGGMVLNPARGDAYYPTTPRNLLGSTEDFSAAAWNKVNTTPTSNVIIAPNGLQTADLVAATAGSSGTSVWQSGGPTWTSSSLVLFNLATGAVGTVTTGSFTSTSITPIGDGWYRCAAVKDGYTLSFYAKAGAWTCVALQTFGSEGMRIYPSTTSTAVTGTGDGASGVYLWGAQLSNSASLDAYSPVYGAAVTSAAYYAPRLDYSGSSLAALGLLVEEQRTNIVLHSNDFSQAAWTKINGGAGTVPVVTSGQTDPWGGTTAWRVQANAGGTGGGDFSLVRQVIASVSSPRSIWIKSNTGSNQSVTFGSSLGTRVVTATTTWTRVTDAPSSANTVFDIGSQPSTGNTTQSIDVLIWGAQCETASGGASVTFATSYIPNGSAVAGATRTADVASVSTQAFPYSATEGTVVVSATVINTAVNSNRYIGFNLASSQLANRMIDVFKASPQYANYKSSDAQQTGFGVWQDNSKVGVVYKADDYVFVANGGTVVTDTSTSGLSTADTMVIGQLNGSNQLNGHIRQITYLPRRLPNADLIARTV